MGCSTVLMGDPGEDTSSAGIDHVITSRTGDTSSLEPAHPNPTTEVSIAHDAGDRRVRAQ